MMIEEVINILINNGILGVVLMWFMFRMEKVVKNNTEILSQVKIKLK